jgi:hypothetical protein
VKNTPAPSNVAKQPSAAKGKGGMAVSNNALASDAAANAIETQASNQKQSIEPPQSKSGGNKVN